MADTYKQQLLKETLNQKFDMERFVRFVSEFFNDVQMTNQYVPDVRIWGEYREQIKSFARVGKYMDSNKKKVDIFAIEVNRESTVECARSLQRNFVSRLITGTATAAIVAFYDPHSENWRLSFVKLDYAFTPKGVKVEVTPAKRYSYLVGKGEGIHTAQRQLLPIFENERENPTVEQIEEAFSVETVTKEFFNSYKDEYLRLKEYLEDNEVFTETAEKNNFTSEQFAKKLMGQLAFLYFLQKKGWLGVGVAPKELTKVEFEEIYFNQKTDAREVFMQHYGLTAEGNYRRYKIDELEKDTHKADLFAGCFRGTKFYKPWGKGNTNFIRSIYINCSNRKLKFFDDYLEPLFYNALNNPRGENDYFPRFNSKVPFLNGGLFEPLFADWKSTNFDIPNWIFSKEGTDSKDDGILDVFDTFNFTINEDEPLEREVAVDPEMLGKIFENLLDVKDRKSKGAFYTPREIVHYMCQESLINYIVNETSVPYEDMKQFVLYGEVMTNQDSSKKTLDGDQSRLIPETVFERLDSIDEKLESVRIADPAVGSGAFPLGILNEVVKLRNNITQYMLNRIPREFRMEREGLLKRRNPYTLKWSTIQNCIFAVDIEASAVDITKLRLWLSLIVDQQIDNVNEKPHALPNLDCNIMCGNSLIEEFEGIQLFDEKLLEQVDLSRPLQQKTANATQLTLDTAKQEQELDTMFKELFAMQAGLFGEDDPARKKEIKQKIEKKTSDIIDYKLNGIDKNHEVAKRYRQSIEKHEKPYFIWKLEFARVFKEKDGFDIVIGNPPYGAELSIEDKELIKTKLKDTNNLNTASVFMDYSKNMWVKNTGINALIIPKSLIYSQKWLSLAKALVKNTTVLVDVEKAFEKVKLEQVVYVLNLKKNKETYEANKFIDNEFTNTLQISNEMIDKFQAWICDVKHEELDYAKQLDIEIEYMSEISITKRGIGVQKFITEDGEYEVIGGKNIRRFGIEGVKGYLSEDVVEKNKKKLQFMMQPKIVSQDLIAHVQNPKPHILITSAYDVKGTVLGLDTVQNTVLTTDRYDYRYIVGLLNSDFISWYTYKFIYCSAIRTMHFDNGYIGKIPVPKVSKKEQQRIVDIVIRIEEVVDNNLLEEVVVLKKDLNENVMELFSVNETLRELIEY